MEKIMGLADETGQAEAAPETGQVADASSTVSEQSVTDNQTTVTGSGDAGESFFDPRDVIGTPAESAYKQMQGEFTKRLQGIKDGQTKIDAYDAFQRDPRGTIEQMARQYGYNFVQSDPNAGQNEAWQPKTWDEVMTKATEQARAELLQEFQPMAEEVQSLKRQGVETHLDTNHPDWRAYESQMVDTLKAHPSMANDPDLLYRMSVPPELIQQRATQAALAKIKDGAAGSEVSGNKTTTVQTKNEPAINTLEDAVAVARERLRAQGIRRPAG